MPPQWTKAQNEYLFATLSACLASAAELAGVNYSGSDFAPRNWNPTASRLTEIIGLCLRNYVVNVQSVKPCSIKAQDFSAIQARKWRDFEPFHMFFCKLIVHKRLNQGRRVGKIIAAGE